MCQREEEYSLHFGNHDLCTNNMLVFQLLHVEFSNKRRRWSAKVTESSSSSGSEAVAYYSSTTHSSGSEISVIKTDSNESTGIISQRSGHSQLVSIPVGRSTNGSTGSTNNNSHASLKRMIELCTVYKIRKVDIFSGVDVRCGRVVFANGAEPLLGGTGVETRVFGVDEPLLIEVRARKADKTGKVLQEEIIAERICVHSCASDYSLQIPFPRRGRSDSSIFSTNSTKRSAITSDNNNSSSNDEAIEFKYIVEPDDDFSDGVVVIDSSWHLTTVFYDSREFVARRRIYSKNADDNKSCYCASTRTTSLTLASGPSSGSLSSANLLQHENDDTNEKTLPGRVLSTRSSSISNATNGNNRRVSSDIIFSPNEKRRFWREMFDGDCSRGYDAVSDDLAQNEERALLGVVANSGCTSFRSFNEMRFLQSSNISTAHLEDRTDFGDKEPVTHHNVITPLASNVISKNYTNSTGKTGVIATGRNNSGDNFIPSFEPSMRGNDNVSRSGGQQQNSFSLKVRIPGFDEIGETGWFTVRPVENVFWENMTVLDAARQVKEHIDSTCQYNGGRPIPLHQFQGYSNLMFNNSIEIIVDDNTNCDAEKDNAVFYDEQQQHKIKSTSDSSKVSHNKTYSTRENSTSRTKYLQVYSPETPLSETVRLTFRFRRVEKVGPKLFLILNDWEYVMRLMNILRTFSGKDDTVVIASELDSYLDWDARLKLDSLPAGSMWLKNSMRDKIKELWELYAAWRFNMENHYSNSTNGENNSEEGTTNVSTARSDNYYADEENESEGINDDDHVTSTNADSSGMVSNDSISIHGEGPFNERARILIDDLETDILTLSTTDDESRFHKNLWLIAQVSFLEDGHIFGRDFYTSQQFVINVLRPDYFHKYNDALRFARKKTTAGGMKKNFISMSTISTGTSENTNDETAEQELLRAEKEYQTMVKYYEDLFYVMPSNILCAVLPADDLAEKLLFMTDIGSTHEVSNSSHDDSNPHAQVKEIPPREDVLVFAALESLSGGVDLLLLYWQHAKVVFDARLMGIISAQVVDFIGDSLVSFLAFTDECTICSTDNDGDSTITTSVNVVPAQLVLFREIIMHRDFVIDEEELCDNYGGCNSGGAAGRGRGNFANADDTSASSKKENTNTSTNADRQEECRREGVISTSKTVQHTNTSYISDTIIDLYTAHLGGTNQSFGWFLDIVELLVSRVQHGQKNKNSNDNSSATSKSDSTFIEDAVCRICNVKRVVDLLRMVIASIEDRRDFQTLSVQDQRLVMEPCHIASDKVRYMRVLEQLLVFDGR